MKKISKIKRLFVLVLIFLLSINCFAAIVSDSDGSSFITKGEFDIIKMNFTQQIEDYNKSITGKIDGAIASYLEGSQYIKEEPTKVYYSDMNKVKMMGYNYSDEWWEPDITLSQSCTYRGRYSPTNAAQQVNWKYCNIKYARKESQKVAANIVSAGIESATKPATVTWVGRASNYCDKISMTKMQAFEGGLTGEAATSRLQGFMDSPETAAVALQNATHIIPGFYKTYTDLQTIWPQVWTWRGSVINLDLSLVEGVWSGSIELDKWAGDTTYDSHILHWNKYDMYVHDNTWNNTLTRLPAGATRKGTTTTITEDTLIEFAKDATLPGSELSGQWYVHECTDTAADHVSKYYGNNLTGITYSGAGLASTDQPVRVGLLPWIYESDKILQTDRDFVASVKFGSSSKSYSDTEPTLLEGFILGAANKGDRIRWQPKFINRESTDGTTPTNNFELDVSFCIGGFGEGFNLKTGSEYIRKEKSTGTETFYTTSSGELSGLTLVMPNDGIIYVKWRPTSTNTTGTTAFAKSWSADLDLLNCDTYGYIKAEE